MEAEQAKARMGCGLAELSEPRTGERERWVAASRREGSEAGEKKSWARPKRLAGLKTERGVKKFFFSFSFFNPNANMIQIKFK